MEKVRIAWLGTGLMGKPMAGRLLQAGYSLSVYNRTSSKAASLNREGARLASSPAEAMRDAEGIILMLTDAGAIQDVLFDRSTMPLLTGRTVIQMGTIGPKESLHIQDRTLAAGGEYLEAPVLGSVGPAGSGELIVMFGGTEDQFDRWRPLLSCFGSDPVFAGPVGQAAALKLALNQMIASLIAAFSLSLGMVLSHDVPVEAFMRVLRRSTLYAETFEKKLPRLLERDFAEPNFPLRLLLKDVRLCLQAARQADLDPAVLRGVEDVIKTGLKMGIGELDYVSMYNVIHPQK
ncbi:MAG: NAD(P)-dependent oxidoreductase [Anaerolineales bacterium]|jgi:3-hydroxyisobutyrate dehydrogenase-like beta-hydroxyacid dehydrogenase